MRWRPGVHGERLVEKGRRRSMRGRAGRGEMMRVKGVR
jgi:hypothetical protein